ncbi:hypothetical protein DTO013E5_1427 [Penicillium roqueforti]|nr:hypothetical protein DTO012A1_1954 [Penicillium roqueforti]KAI2754144.1 hypothetical protein DTO013F2_1970 [Penicillium roqueforti]KAI3078964.1 hypothetical protein CBS147339_4084 [Penicillium roqueforti]KAI3098242.1 hypothetical protein CBS147333_9101 [Penicillium roqueforti]KAI3139104.1 hypothetical protein CBS147326_2782 [Penicillium roqueforti]
MIGNFWINPFGGEQYPHYIDSFGHHRLNEWSPALVDGLRIDTVVSDKQPESSQTPRCNRQPQRCEAVVALAVRVDTRHSKKESSYPVMIELGCHMHAFRQTLSRLSLAAKYKASLWGRAASNRKSSSLGSSDRINSIWVTTNRATTKMGLSGSPLVN